MEPWFGKNDKKMFYKYLKNTNVYFEYGSGGTTYQAGILNNIKKIYSVESDIQWQDKLKKVLNPQTLQVKINTLFWVYGETPTRHN